MKPDFSLALVFGVILAASSRWAVAVAPPPRVVCDAATFDFGVVSYTDTVVHDFSLDNQGEGMLVFGQLRACCGATASLRDQQVPPGSNTLLNVKLAVKGRRGPLNKSISVATNDPRQPHMMLRLTGVVTGSVDTAGQVVFGYPGQPSTKDGSLDIHDIVVAPKHLTVILSEAPAAPVTRYVALRSRSRTPFAIKGVSLPGNAQIKSQTPCGDAGWRVEISGLLPSDNLDGAIILFHTDRAGEPPLSIPIRVIPPQGTGAPSP